MDLIPFTEHHASKLPPVNLSKEVIKDRGYWLSTGASENITVA